MALTRLTIVVPAYNEAEVLPLFHARLADVLDHMPVDAKVIYVDDGSRDGTWLVLDRLATEDVRVSALRLSRNFGKEAALTAALDAVPADVDAVVIIDADLQDPPELIPELLQRWIAGFDVVYATRAHREGDTWLKRATAHVFYRLLVRLTAFSVPPDTGDFRLMSMRVVMALRQLRERQRFMKGLFGWVGFPHTAVLYQRSPRQAGRTKWNYWRLFNLAIEGVTSFSILPLRLATAVGMATSTIAFCYGALVFIKAVMWGNPVKGYPSLMVVVLVLGGLQLLALGVIGEYLGRTYAEVKQRPIYLIEASRQASMAPLQRQKEESGATINTQSLQGTHPFDASQPLSAGRLSRMDR